MNEFQAKRMNDGDKLSIASKAICERKVQWCHPEWWLPEAWSTRISSTRRTGQVWEAIFWIFEHYFQVHGPTWLFPSIENPGWKSWLQSCWCRGLSCFEANEQGLQKESTRADVAPATAHQCSCQWPRLLSGQQLVSKDLTILIVSVASAKWLLYVT